MSASITQVYSADAEGPIYVTFWTQHGTYPEHGREWVDQMQAHGVAYQAAFIVTEDLTWCGRCRLKPWWLLKVMEQYPDRNVIWMDVDSVVVEVPPFTEADIGIIPVPEKFAKIGRYTAAVIHFRNNEVVRRVMGRWQQLCETEPEDFSCDMNLLERAIHSEPEVELDLLDVGHAMVPELFPDPEHLYVYGKQASRVERHRR